MEELFQTTISKRNQLFTWSSDWEEVCKSSSKPWLERPSPSMLNHQTPLITLRPRSKIRKVSPPINKDLSSLENSSKTEEPYLTTTFKRNQPFTWFLDWEEDNEKNLKGTTTTTTTTTTIKFDKNSHKTTLFSYITFFINTESLFPIYPTIIK